MAADLADLIFPSAASQPTISQLLGDLRRSNLSIGNRLRSIRRDAEFVRAVRGGPHGGGGGRPLVANERCGSWYVEPALKGASAYFKSTDGHTGQWKFSTRRLNLHLLPLVGEHDGIIIVDSTRRGKPMPDALSKTVPIWCCVLNRVLFPERPACHALYVPPSVVSASEQSQMLARVPSFVASFTQLGIDPAPLRRQVSKPLRPVWVTPDSADAVAGRHGGEGGEGGGGTAEGPPAPIFDDFHPVVCCTASRRAAGGTELGGGAGYVQGAGDDTENWALGLTPPVFWAHAAELLAAAEADLPGLIAGLVDAAARPGAGAGAGGAGGAGGAPSSRRQLTPHLHVCPLGPDGAGAFADPGPGWCAVLLAPRATEAGGWARAPARLEVGVGKHKTASRHLRHALPHICAFVGDFLAGEEGGEAGGGTGGAGAGAGADATQQEPPRRRVLIACESGKDISVGVALALLCWCFDGEGRPRARPADGRGFNKTLIKARLGRIMTAMPEANPSRATLQSVNTFLMDWRSR